MIKVESIYNREGINMSDVKSLEKKYEVAWDKYNESDLKKVFVLSDK